MKHLIATKGHKYYNGDIITNELYMPDDADESVWRLITDTEAKKIKAEQAILANALKDTIETIIEE